MGLKLILTLVFVLFVILLLMFYFVPFNVVTFETKLGNYNFSMFQSESKMQFYPNMRFPSPDISYRISDCPLKKTNDMELAFDMMENLTSLRFNELYNNEEILITCEEKIKMSREGFFKAGEGGPTNITKAGDFYVILSGEVLLIKESDCPKPNIALHELFHVLGFEHSTNSENIMYNVTSCDQTIGDDMIQLINELYSVPSYPDLAFGNVSAVMKGRFVDVNVTVMNLGLDNAEESKIIVYTDDNPVKEIDLGPINIGYGTIIVLGNIWVSQINVNEMSMVIEYNSDEINKENNKIELGIS